MPVKFDNMYKFEKYCGYLLFLRKVKYFRKQG